MAFLEKSKESTEAFIALLVNEESVQAGIWRIEKGKTKVVSVGERQTWEGKETKDLVESVDISLSAAASKLTEAEFEEPEKVIFGLPQGWTDEGKITEEKLALLKELSLRLSLKPMGFVVTTEALTHFLKAKEGASPSAILIGLDSEKIQVVLIRLGKVLGSESVARSDNLALDVEEGLLRLSRQETFPPRMILFGEGDLESVCQTLVSYPWQEPERKLPFLHFPRVEIAPENFEINALCLAGGTELAKSEELVSEEKDQREVEKKPDRKPAATRLPSPDGEATGGQAEPLKEAEALKIEGEREEMVEKEEGELEQDLGFVVGEDVLAETGQRGDTEEVETQKEKDEKVEKVEQAEEVEKGVKIRGLVSLILAKIKLSRLRLPKLGLPSFAFRPPKLVFVGLTLVVFGVLFWVFKTMPRAQMTIFVSPEELKKEWELKLDPNVVARDEKRKVFPAQLIEASVSQSKTKTTTGRKTVGEKAKGEVMIFNIGNSKNLAAGTILIGPGEFKFTLDQAVSVASGSALGGPGQVKANITAADIGADYNLASGSEFTISNFDKSILAAKNESALTGGTSRQVQIVSEEDRVLLKKDLQEILEKRAEEEIGKKVAGSQRLVKESLQTKVSQENYDRKVGEEAQEATLTLAVKATGLVFEQNDLRDFLRLLLKDEIGEQDFRWEEADLNFQAENVNDDGSIQFKTEVSGKLYPAIDEKEIVRNLTGKSLAFQKNYLNSLPKVTGFETKIIPSFFIRFGRLPSLEKNIKVEIRAK